MDFYQIIDFRPFMKLEFRDKEDEFSIIVIRHLGNIWEGMGENKVITFSSYMGFIIDNVEKAIEIFKECKECSGQIYHVTSFH